MQIDGWRTQSVFDNYAIITEDDIADAVHKLEEDRKRRAVTPSEVEAHSHESITETAVTDAPVANSKLLN